VTQDSSSQVTTGLVMVVIGLVLLGGQLDLFDFWRVGRLWPLVMVAIGAAQWAATPPPGARRQGLGLMLGGSVLLLHTLNVMRIWDSWPLFIVAFGVSLLTGRRSCGANRVEGPHVF
jgi:hypothetical protein